MHPEHLVYNNIPQYYIRLKKKKKDTKKRFQMYLFQFIFGHLSIKLIWSFDMCLHICGIRQVDCINKVLKFMLNHCA